MYTNNFEYKKIDNIKSSEDLINYYKKLEKNSQLSSKMFISSIFTGSLTFISHAKLGNNKIFSCGILFSSFLTMSSVGILHQNNLKLKKFPSIVKNIKMTSEESKSFYKQLDSINLDWI